MPLLEYTQKITGTGAVVTELSRVDSLIHGMGTTGSQTGKTVESSFMRMGSVMSSVRGIAAGLGLTFGVIGAVQLFKAQIDSALGFEKAMTASLAIMGNVSTMMRREMAEAAREVGRTTAFSATQAAEAFYFLASAGLDAKQSIAALPTVTRF